MRESKERRHFWVLFEFNANINVKNAPYPSFVTTLSYLILSLFLLILIFALCIQLRGLRIDGRVPCLLF